MQRRDFLSITSLALIPEATVEPTCHSCQWIKRLPGEAGVGACKRHPPNVQPRGFNNASSPRVLLDDWCGDYEERK